MENMISAFKQLLNQQTIPPYIEREDSLVRLIVNDYSHGLERTLIIEYAGPFDVDAEFSAENIKNAYIESVNDYYDEHYERRIPIIGQQTRLLELIRSAAETADEKGDVKISMRTARSVMDFHMSPYRITFVAMDPKTNRTKFLGQKDSFRQMGYLDLRHDIPVQVVEFREGIIKAFKELDYAEFMEQAIKFKFQRDNLASAVVEAVVRKELKLDKDWFAIGGNPDNGSLLISNRFPFGLKITSYQKLAKLTLAGGVIVQPSFKFKAVKFDSRLKKEWLERHPDPRDGVIAIISFHAARKLAVENGIQGYVFQTRIAKYGLKGTIMSPITDIAEKILGYNYAVIDVDEVNKVYDVNVKEGDMVDVEDLLILRSDAQAVIGKMKLNHQALDRAGKAQGMFLEAMIDAIRNASPLDFIPEYGIYKPMKKLGKFIEWKVGGLYEGVNKLINDAQMRNIQDGPKAPGAWLYNVPSGVKRGEVLISGKFARKFGLKKGDYVTFIISPTLLPNKDGRSEFLFSAKIAGFLKGNTVSISLEGNKTALRDWDGDFLIVFPGRFALEQPNAEVYSAKDTPKEEFLKSFLGGFDVLKFFHSNSSIIGRIDNMIKMATRFMLGDEIDEAYMNRVGQGGIQNKKHNILKRFLVTLFEKLLKDKLPWMWTNKNGVLVLNYHVDHIIHKVVKTFKEAKLVFQAAMEWKPEEHSIWVSKLHAMAKLELGSSTTDAVRRLIETATSLHYWWEVYVSQGDMDKAKKLANAMKPTKAYIKIMEETEKLSSVKIPTISISEMRDLAMAKWLEVQDRLSDSEVLMLNDLRRIIVAEFVSKMDKDPKAAHKHLDRSRKMLRDMGALVPLCINWIANTAIDEDGEKGSIYVPLYLLGDKIVDVVNDNIDYTEVSLKELEGHVEDFGVKTLIYRSKGIETVEIGKDLEIGTKLLIQDGDVVLQNGLEAKVAKKYPVEDGEYEIISKSPYILKNGETSSSSTWIILKEVK